MHTYEALPRSSPAIIPSDRCVPLSCDAVKSSKRDVEIESFGHTDMQVFHVHQLFTQPSLIEVYYS